MPISSGDKLGPYEILTQIGAGGMGEVWKARDTRLDRIVAIKTSKAEFSERFAREAKAIAALNHPHICQLHDVGPDYLVMEYVEGSPLKGPLAEDRAVEYAGQILSALDAAHRKGITHRDLKPANIMVTRQHGIKLLDFGLARIAAGSGDSTVTQPGEKMGTPAYMSPEQWEGKPGDARTDIYCFGCVLYEMLTGKRAVQEGRPQVKWPPLEGIIVTCMKTDPEERWQSARDVRETLSLPTPSVPKPRPLWPWIATAVAALALAAVSLWAPWRGVSTVEQPIVKLDLDLGATVSESNVGTDTILSSDGTRLVFVSQSADGKSHLSSRRLDQPRPIELPGTEGAYGPFLSPDGLSVGFFAGGKLKKTSLDGGDPVILCDAPAGRGGTWTEDGSIIAALEPVRGLVLIPSAGGQPTPLTEVETGETGHRFPHALPGGKAVLFTFSSANGNYEDAGIAAVSVKDRRRKNILEHVGMNPIYLPGGHLVYVTKGSLFAVPFDAERLEIAGQAKPVIEDVANDLSYGSAQVSFSRAGRLVYRAGRAERLRDVLWLAGDGGTQKLWPEPAIVLTPRFSPDGRRLAIFINDGPSSDLWVYDIDKTTKTRLTNGLYGSDAAWTQDGQFIVFQLPGGIFWTRADGAGKPQPLITSKAYMRPGSFSPDGRRLVYSELLTSGGGAIKTAPIESTSSQLRAGQPEIFLQPTATSNAYPRFSHDGRWLAYMDAQAGSFEVYVRAFPDSGAKWQISNDGGGFPVWSPNGHELFYRSPDNRIMEVNYSIRGAEFSADKPRLWSERRLFNQGISPTFDLAPDGKRFAVLMQPGGDQPRTNLNHVTLLLNFFDEVRRRVPTGK